MNKDITVYLEFVLGILIAAVGYEFFMLPTKVIYGVGGIAILLHKIFSVSTNITIFILSVFLLIVSYIMLGKKQSRKSFVGSLLFPIFVYLISLAMPYMPNIEVETIVSVISGAVITGVGLGLVMKAGFTTGGTDILNQIVSQYFKISIGNSMLIIDGAIVVTSGLFFGINNMMYSIVLLYIISLISDRVILGISESKVFFIATSKEKEVKKFIIEELGHGVTIFHAEGGFKKQNQTILMTTLPTRKYYALKEGIKKIDNEAFYIITDTYEVFGGE